LIKSSIATTPLRGREKGKPKRKQALRKLLLGNSPQRDQIGYAPFLFYRGQRITVGTTITILEGMTENCMNKHDNNNNPFGGLRAHNSSIPVMPTQNANVVGKTMVAIAPLPCQPA